MYALYTPNTHIFKHTNFIPQTLIHVHTFTHTNTFTEYTFV